MGLRSATVILLALVAVLATGANAQAAEPTTWVCKPGQSPNPCVGDLTTTSTESDGRSTVRAVPNARDPKVDCFYVYPTVSDQPTANANKDVDPPISAISEYQAQRFSENCRVFAPVYRQRTAAAIYNPSVSEAQAFALAYVDVLAAWKEYLAEDNHGRGVILIGHSQGSRMLRRLITEEIDPRASERQRLISAIIPGANVLVKKGSGLGGDFQHVPACSSSSQLGCVMAWSSFNQTPPSNTRFGRYAPPAGQPDDQEVLCTNPAALAGGAQAPLHSLLPSKSFPPGLIAADLSIFYGGMQPTAATPWLQPRDHYSARCVREAGTNTLRIFAEGGARQLNPAPDATWGLHIGDVNLALGDLVAITRRQSDTYLRAASLRTAAACQMRGGAARGRSLGRFALGTSRARARARLTGRRSTRRAGLDGYCVTGGGGVRVGYPTRRTRPAALRRRLEGRAVLVLATSRRFSVHGVRPGSTRRTLTRRLRGERRVRVGQTTWYAARGASATLVFRMRGSRVAAVGVASRTLTRSPSATRRLLDTWHR